MDVKQYTIQELSDLTGFTRRTIRYYIQEGLLDPPAGRGRGGFYYDSHLNKLQQIKSLQEKGLTLSAITILLKTTLAESVNYVRNIWVRYDIAPGLELNIRRDLEQRESQKISEIIKLAKALLEENGENE